MNMSAKPKSTKSNSPKNFNSRTEVINNEII